MFTVVIHGQVNASVKLDGTELRVLVLVHFSHMVKIVVKHVSATKMATRFNVYRITERVYVLQVCINKFKNISYLTSFVSRISCYVLVYVCFMHAKLMV